MSAVSDALSALVALVKNDTLKAVLPPLAAFFTNVAADPAAVNVAVQLTKFQVDVLAALPAVEKDLFTSIATLINTELANLPK